ncbi:MAG: TonB-dependent receptor [Planctomycetota bacterium]
MKASLHIVALVLLGAVMPVVAQTAGQSMNPDLSVIIDTFMFYDDSQEGLEHLYSEIEGFGHIHAGGEEHGHDHGPNQGFNIRHLELMLSAEVDPAFKARAIAAVLPEGAEIEEAVIETTSLPGGLALRVGKFFSDFGRINPQHEHEYDFTEGPLINTLVFGHHGINDLGLQVSWLAPTEQYLLCGLELFQGGAEEGQFVYLGAEELPEWNGPRLGVCWAKYAPTLPGPHGLQLGVSFGSGIKQEEHDGNADGTPDHWLDGRPFFWGVDFVYKFDAVEAYGKGDIAVQFEYIYRNEDLEVIRHDLIPALEGEHTVNKQGGYYLQATYGFAPQWRAGLRYEQVGVVNDITLPDGTHEEPDASSRTSAMVDYSYSEFSRLRFGIGQGTYATADGTENALAAIFQFQISIGEHGAHKF